MRNTRALLKQKSLKLKRSKNTDKDYERFQNNKKLWKKTLVYRPYIRKVAATALRNWVQCPIEIVSLSVSEEEVDEESYYLPFEIRLTADGYYTNILVSFEYNKWQKSQYMKLSGLPREYFDDDIDFYPCVLWTDATEHLKHEISYK